jgi:hypothetical protein
VVKSGINLHKGLPFALTRCYFIFTFKENIEIAKNQLSGLSENMFPLNLKIKHQRSM